MDGKGITRRGHTGSNYQVLPGDRVFVPIDADYATAERIVLSPNVEMLIVGDDTIAGSVVWNHPEQFVPQFHSMAGWTPCTIYLRR